jgi:Helix-turn-helix domain
MSIRALTWSHSLRGLSPSEHTVLHCLASHHNYKTGLCFPLVPTIAEETGCGRSTVDKAITRLVEMELVSRYPWEGKSAYLLALPHPGSLLVSEEEENDSFPGRDGSLASSDSLPRCEGLNLKTKPKIYPKGEPGEGARAPARATDPTSQAESRSHSLVTTPELTEDMKDWARQRGVSDRQITLEWWALLDYVANPNPKTGKEVVTNWPACWRSWWKTTKQTPSGGALYEPTAAAMLEVFDAIIAKEFGGSIAKLLAESFRDRLLERSYDDSGTIHLLGCALVGLLIALLVGHQAQARASTPLPAQVAPPAEPQPMTLEGACSAGGGMASNPFSGPRGRLARPR